MANKIGPLIREARTAAGLTQEQLARKIKGLEAAEISKAERGELELTQAMLREIARATGVTQSSLINAAKESTYKSAKAAPKTAAKTTAAKTAAKKADAGEVKLTAAEKKLVELYRAADTETKKTAMGILKGEPLELSTILSSLLSKTSDSSGKEGLLGSLLGGGSSSSSGGGELLESLLSSFGKK